MPLIGGAPTAGLLEFVQRGQPQDLVKLICVRSLCCAQHRQVVERSELMTIVWARPRSWMALGRLLRGGVADNKRDQREIVEHLLKEGQLCFERYFPWRGPRG